MRSGLVWLLGLGLMTTPAVANEPPRSLDELFSRALAEKDPKRRDALLLEGVREAFNLNAQECLGVSLLDCQQAITHRLMLYWTEHELAAPSQPVSPSKPGRVLTCSAGEALGSCLERSLGPGTLGAGEYAPPVRHIFIYVLPQPPRAVRFVIGEVSAANGLERMGQEAYSFEVLADDSREDPLFLEVLRTYGERTVTFAFSPDERTVSFGLSQVLEAERYVQNVEGSRTFVTNRRLGQGFFAICGKELRKVEKPKLVRVVVGLGEDAQVLFPEYHYALPCKASFVLDESIAGLRAGKYGPGSVCPVRKKGPAGATPQGEEDVPFAILEDPATHQCRMELRGVREESAAVFSGDLNGDGRRDFIIRVIGEMGCGGPNLYLSSPQGWFRAGFSDHYC
jgi:hypothetical protein